MSAVGGHARDSWIGHSGRVPRGHSPLPRLGLLGAWSLAPSPSGSAGRVVTRRHFRSDPAADRHFLCVTRSTAPTLGSPATSTAGSRHPGERDYRYPDPMRRRANGAGPRSGLYSEQRFTNWTPHDPHWSEVEALPARMRPKAQVGRGDHCLGIFERPLAEDFVRSWTAAGVAEVLCTVPLGFVSQLEGVYLMAGTAKQGRARVVTHGVYSRNRIYLFPVPARRMAEGWPCARKPNDIRNLRAFGAEVRPSGNRRVIVAFDEESLRRFYLYNVLLHEIGHHVDRERASGAAERYARWFAEFQYAHLLSPGK